jgi:enoyl-CoA hydratase/carnithine racemase
VELSVEPLRIQLPERLDSNATRRIAAALASVRDEPAIVLEGAANAFCLGMDFRAVVALADGRPNGTDIRAEMESYADCLLGLLLAKRPTLAIVEGPALGGGLGFAAACDCVLATESAQFGLPEALYGFTPAIIRPALLTRLSPQRLNLLLVTAHARDAAEAHQMGLVDRIVATDKLKLAQKSVLRAMGRARSEAVAMARGWNKDDLARAIADGVNETSSALLRPDVLSAFRATLSEDQIPWRS